MKGALEITTFKLAKGYSAESFVAANADVDAWLQRQPGFRSRWIAVQSDGTVFDVLERITHSTLNRPAQASKMRGREALQRF